MIGCLADRLNNLKLDHQNGVSYGQKTPEWIIQLTPIRKWVVSGQWVCGIGGLHVLRVIGFQGIQTMRYLPHDGVVENLTHYQ